MHRTAEVWKTNSHGASEEMKRIPIISDGCREKGKWIWLCLCTRAVRGGGRSCPDAIGGRGMNRIKGFLSDDSGADLLEYAVPGGLISPACVATLTSGWTHIGA